MPVPKYDSEEERQQDIKWLKDIIDKAGRIVYGNVKNVSRSGMQRQARFYIIVPLTKKEQEIRRGTTEKSHVYNISYKIARLLKYPYNNDWECVTLNGCGMDMLWHTVYNLGRNLYPNGDGVTVTGRNGDKNPETDGGYLLRTEYL